MSEDQSAGTSGENDVVEDAALLNDLADRLILGGAWTWADGGLGTTR
ncbi:hypothetical protein VXE65_20950 [Mycolicibacterium conceptionense]